jgi:hypothetical protein
MGSDYGGTVPRFAKGDTVWVSPTDSGYWLTDDEATVLEDVGSGYLVLQAAERVSSYGQGHYVCDAELSGLHDVPQLAAEVEKVAIRDFRLADFGSRATRLLNAACGYRNTDTGSMRILTHV